MRIHTQIFNPATPSLYQHFPLNPRGTQTPFPPVSLPIFSFKGNEFSISVSNHHSFSSSSPSNCLNNEESRSDGIKDIDISTLGNLCVDIVLSVPKLPPASKEDRKAFMERLAESRPDKLFWEAGGNCNMAIAAARLGLQCTVLGHVGDETYGHFLLDVLHDEGISMVGMSEEKTVTGTSDASYETLLCWVLVDPLRRHGFCSRADFSEEPAFSWMTKLSTEVKIAIRRSKILCCNGYCFDELSPSLIVSALEYAVQVGTSVFFDPGPRGKSLSVGTPEEQRALGQCLTMCDVLLLTSDEAESLTAIKNPVMAGRELLKKGTRTKWVIVKMGARGSVLITKSNLTCAPAFKVKIIDTVGCGDSYVAAIAYGFICNTSLVGTLLFANAVGAATAMGCGAGRNVATLERVIKLMRASNLNEDDKFWNELIDKNQDTQEVMILSETVINGSNRRLGRTALRKVVAELLPQLESVSMKRVPF